jgi:signal transduction histidine kinase
MNSPIELAQLVGAWPWALPLIASLGSRGLLAGRRRTALNEALHELRRPLQALALAPPQTVRADRGGAASSVQMAAAALERLEREINGGVAAPVRAPLELGPLLEAAAGRWQRRADLAGGYLRLDLIETAVTVNGDRDQVSQALDNLIVNALEHGGPEVVLAAVPAAGSARITVTDSGRAIARVAPRRGPGALARLSGRRRRGHGLRVVHRVAAAHDGRFHLRCSRSGTEAVIELPLLCGDPA